MNGPLDPGTPPNYNRDMSTPSPAPPKRKRRWLQYSLRSLLALMAVAAVLLGWLRYHLNQIAKERAAVAAIRELGGGVIYEETGGVRDANGDLIERRPAGPEWLRRLFGDDFFDSIDVIGYEGPHCREVLAQVENLRGLKFLSVTGRSVDDESLAHITKFRELRTLYLNNASITDAGVERLQALSNLEDLQLKNTPITDQAVEAILGLPKLKNVIVHGTHITAHGISRLYAAGLPRFPHTPAPDEHQRSIAVQVEEKGGNTHICRTTDGSRCVYNVLICGVDSLGNKKERPSIALLCGLSNLGPLVLISLSLDDEETEALRRLRPLKVLRRPQLVMDNVTLSDRQWDRLCAPVSPSEDSATRPTEESSNSALVESLEEVSLAGTTVSDVSLARIATFPNLRELSLDGGHITANGLRSLARSRKLKRLELVNVTVSKDDKDDDACRAQMEPFANLECLIIIDDDKVTDAGLRGFSAMANLKRLKIRSRLVGDDGLPNLLRLTKLEQLELCETSMTVEGLKRLRQLPLLKRLHVCWPVGIELPTDLEAEELGHALPGVVFQGHEPRDDGD